MSGCTGKSSLLIRRSRIKARALTLQLLLEFEVEDGDAEKPESLLDHLTEGLVTALGKSSPPHVPSITKADRPDQSGPYESQPYLVSLLTLSTGTRLFETILLHSPLTVFEKVWSTYFEGKIGKLAIHPMSNFVVAKGVERLDGEGIDRVVTECKAVSGGRGMISE